MKIKDNFVLRELAGEYIVIPTGEAAAQFNGMMNLTESAAFIWKKVDEGLNNDEIVQLLLKEFDVDEETAKVDVNGFINDLITIGIIENQ